MPLTTDRPPAAWADQAAICEATDHLVESLGELCPSSGALIADHEYARIPVALGLRLEWGHSPPGRGGCELAGTYDGWADPPLITVMVSGNSGREAFTLLHELAHHLLFVDEEWQYNIRPNLGTMQGPIEERIADQFAATVLVPNQVVAQHLSPVTPQGILALKSHTAASITACCIRALSVPGDRLILVQNTDGRVIVSQSTGSPRAPSKDVFQPLLQEARDFLSERPDDICRVGGGEGIMYKNGWAATNVMMEAATDGDLILAVLTPTRTLSRLGTSWQQNQPTCSTCATDFSADDSPGECLECGTLKCPHCGTCECGTRRLVVCEECFIALSATEVRKGLRVHEECP